MFSPQEKTKHPNKETNTTQKNIVSYIIYFNIFYLKKKKNSLLVGKKNKCFNPTPFQATVLMTAAVKPSMAFIKPTALPGFDEGRTEVFVRKGVVVRQGKKYFFIFQSKIYFFSLSKIYFFSCPKFIFFSCPKFIFFSPVKDPVIIVLHQFIYCLYCLCSILHL